jgi:hypothetical protein
MPCTFHIVALEFYILGQNHSADEKFDGRSFRIPSEPYTEIDFLFDFKIQKVSAFMSLTEFLYLVSDI